MSKQPTTLTWEEVMQFARTLFVVSMVCFSLSGAGWIRLSIAAEANKTSIPAAKSEPIIKNVSPEQLTTSTKVQTVALSGTGFDAQTKVEVIYGVGPGAGQWRAPSRGFQVVSSTKILVNVLTGPDRDSLRFRAINSHGNSNRVTVAVVTPTPVPIAKAPSTPPEPPKTADANKPITPSAPPATAQPQPQKAVTTPAPVTMPQIANISPARLTISPQTQSIIINGSGFDTGTRVEWMYGVGAGAGTWRAPLHGFQVLSSTKLRVNVQTGNDPDQLRIRVINSHGTSNQFNVAIEKSAASVVANAPIVAPAPTVPSASTAVQPKTTAAPPALPAVASVPAIASVIPSKLAVSPQIQTIIINGSGFDAGTRVEWMYGVGPGAGTWRTPLHGYQRISSTQMQVQVQSGNDPDQLRIRVTNSNGASNQVTVAIEKTATVVAPAASTIVSPKAPVFSPGITAGSTPSGTELTNKQTIPTPSSMRAPHIASVNPTTLPTSTEIQTITINGNSFDADTRVEWMYGVGAGAGTWRTPLHGYQQLSNTQIQVKIQTGNAPDQIHIRVRTNHGFSNQLPVSIVKSAQEQIANNPPRPAGNVGAPASQSGPVAPITQNIGSDSKSGGVLPTLERVNGVTYKTKCPESTCNREWDDYLLVGYINTPYQEVTISGTNLDLVTMISGSRDYSATIIGKPSKELLRIRVTASSDDVAPTDRLILTLNGDPKLTISLKVVPTFNDYQIYGQCTWYAWHIMRRKNFQNEISSYSQGLPISEMNLPRSNSVIMNSKIPHTAYVETVTKSEPIINADKSTTVTYTVVGKDANWGGRTKIGSEFSGTMTVTRSADGKSIRVSPVKFGNNNSYEMTHVYY